MHVDNTSTELPHRYGKDDFNIPDGGGGGGEGEGVEVANTGGGGAGAAAVMSKNL